MQDDFYDALAPHNHLLFADWERFRAWQYRIIAPYLPTAKSDTRIVDCACGIGTQLLPLAAAGYTIAGIDSSRACIERTAVELRREGYAAQLVHADLRSDALVDLTPGCDVAVLMDNYLTHARSDDEAVAFLTGMHRLLRRRGTLLLAIRHYEEEAGTKPTGTLPAFYADVGQRRISHQVWDWLDEESYRFHLYFTRQSAANWNVTHFSAVYRPVRRDRMLVLARSAGFDRIELVAPNVSGYHQWLVVAEA